VDSLYVYLGSIARTLNSAGLDVALDTTRETSWAKLAESLRTSSKKGLSPTDQLFEIFMKPFDGKATLTLPTSNGAQSESMIINTRTIIGQPMFGTEHKLTLPSALTSDLGLFQQQKFATVEEVKSYLDWILSLHIAHRLLKSEHSSRATIRCQDPRLTIVSKESRKGATSLREITVQLYDGKLKIAASAVDTPPENGNGEQSHTWNGTDNDASLREVVKNWVG
jgi:mediator of RNA polymerase II transcription subunit 17